jgi:hypothetical protein
VLAHTLKSAPRMNPGKCYQIVQSTTLSRSARSACRLVRRDRWRRYHTFKAMMPVASAIGTIVRIAYVMKANEHRGVSFHLSERPSRALKRNRRHLPPAESPTHRRAC